MAENSTRAIGRDAEELALEHLQSSGLVLIARNFRCRIGEIDLIMRDGNCLVFVEVRFRKAGRFASAAESVDRRKQRKLLGAAAFFLCRHIEYRQHATRFDVIALDGPSRNTFTLQWLQDAFRPG